ncbi:STAS domain-containing protein [Leptospira sp. 96542]|nr:STAS domain-containing protein [Leptospira sp. 96542]
MGNLQFPSLVLNTEIVELTTGRVLVVSFDGQITNTNAYEINRNVSAIFRDEVYNLILDLSKLVYINSIGVATLIGIIKTVESNNGRIMIGGLNHFIENVVRLMDLSNKIEIYNTKKTALEKWSN